MAITASQFDVTQPNGIASAFDLAPGRDRMNVAIADVDDANEAASLQFPSHDSVDRGSPLKIGGYANNYSPAIVAAGDRTNAWFTWQGQLGTVGIRESNVVYDGGRCPIQYKSATLAHAANNTVFLGASAGNRYKVLSIAVTCYAFTASGLVYLTDNVTLAFYVGECWGVNQSWWITNGPNIVYQTGVGADLRVGSDGTGNFAWTVAYYIAP